MTLLQKALDLLKTKYQDLGLSKAVLETMAKKIARRVGEDESKLGEAVDDIAEDMAIFQSLEDRIRTQSGEIDKLKGGGTPKPEDKPIETPAGPTPEEIEAQPQWVKDMMENQKNILAKFSAMETAEVQKSATDKLIGFLKAKDVSESFYSTFIEGREFQNDDAVLEAFADKLKASEANYISANNLQKLNDASETKNQSVFGKAPEGKAGELNEAEKLFIQNQAPKTV